MPDEKKEGVKAEEWAFKNDYCCKCTIQLTEGRPHFNSIDCAQAQNRVIKDLREEFVNAVLWKKENFSRLAHFKDFARAYAEYKRLLKADTTAAEFHEQLKKSTDIAGCWDRMDAAMAKLYPNGFPEGW